MPLAVSPQFTQKNYNYTDWKTIKSVKNFAHQYHDDGKVYIIYGYEFPDVHTCVIFKGPVPPPIIASGYTQQQNDDDKTDFENNLLPSANAAISQHVQFKNNYLRMTGNGTNTVKGGTGILHGIIIANNVTGGLVTIYDNTAASGTVISVIKMATPSGGLLSTTGIPSPLFMGPLGLVFTTGLTIVTSGAPANDVTIIYQ